MSVLEWDKEGERHLEFGTDHGVLYTDRTGEGADDLEEVLNESGDGVSLYYPEVTMEVDSDPADLPSDADYLKAKNRANGITWENGTINPEDGSVVPSLASKLSSVMTISTGYFKTYSLWFWCANKKAFPLDVYWYMDSVYVGKSVVKAPYESVVVPVAPYSQGKRANKFRIVLRDGSQPIQSLYIGQEGEEPGGKNHWNVDTSVSLRSSTTGQVTKTFSVSALMINQNGLVLSANAQKLPTTNATFSVTFKDSGGNAVATKSWTQSSPRWTVSLPADSSRLAPVNTIILTMNVQQAGVNSGVTFSNIQLESGTTATAYEAYVREGTNGMTGVPEGDISAWAEFFLQTLPEADITISGQDPDIPASYYQYGGKIYHGVVWNGLTAITESPEGAEPNDIYADDMKYATLRGAESFGGTIEAFQAPVEFGLCDGTSSPVSGVYIGQQKRKPFGFVYRSKNEKDGGYKLHLIYGATASPSEKSYETTSDSPDAVTFSWEFSTTPISVHGHRPVSLITVDPEKYWGYPVSEDVPENISENGIRNPIHVLEALLFGTADSGAFLPSPQFVIDILGGDRPMALRPNTD